MSDEPTPKVDPGALDALIAAAGIGEDAAASLRQANTSPPVSATSEPAGHGAPAETHEDFGEL